MNISVDETSQISTSRKTDEELFYIRDVFWLSPPWPCCFVVCSAHQSGVFLRRPLRCVKLLGEVRWYVVWW